MRRIKTCCAAAVIVCMSFSPALAYTLNNLGRAGGWDDINKSSVVTTVLDTSRYTTDGGITNGSVASALTAAYGTWAGVSDKDKLNFDFKPDAGGNYDAFDTYPTLDQASNWNYANVVLGGWLGNSYFLNLDPVNGSNILAVTWTAKLHGGNDPRKATWHAEVFFNDGWNWTDGLSAMGGFDIETVALHELGHAIGLGHGDPYDGVPSVMDPFYDGVQRALKPDDVNGLTALYGGGKGNPHRSGGLNKITRDGMDWYLTDVTYIPEPSTLWLLCIAGLCLIGCWWRKRGG